MVTCARQSWTRVGFCCSR